MNLVISNAMLQWCQDLKGALLHLKSLIKDHGELAFSSFGPQNFKEIKSLLDIGLDYKGQDEICAILESLGFKYIFKERVIKEYFAGSHELLSYIKHTGVGALNDKPLSFKELEILCPAMTEILKKVIRSISPGISILSTLLYNTGQAAKCGLLVLIAHIAPCFIHGVYNLI